MIIRSFYYGTAGPEKGGYGYLYDSQEISPQNPHISSNTGTCIRYGSIANVYTLQFVTALNKSKTDRRRQTFIHGYVFDKDAALELMKKPEYIPGIWKQ